MAKNEDGYTVCRMCREKLGFWDICEVSFCTICKKEKECYERYSNCKDCRESEGLKKNF